MPVFEWDAERTPASDSVRNLPPPILSYKGMTSGFVPLLYARIPVRVVVGLEGGNKRKAIRLL